MLGSLPTSSDDVSAQKICGEAFFSFTTPQIKLEMGVALLLMSHGSSEGHEMLKRNDKYHSIADDVLIPKMHLYQNRSMAFFKNCTFVSDTIFFSLAIWLSHLFSRRQAFSSPTG